MYCRIAQELYRLITMKGNVDGEEDWGRGEGALREVKCVKRREG